MYPIKTRACGYWRRRPSKIANLHGHERWVYSAVFSPDGARVLTASDDGTARLWDAATGKEIAVLRGHESGVISAVFSPDGRRILTASTDKNSAIVGFSYRNIDCSHPRTCECGGFRLVQFRWHKGAHRIEGCYCTNPLDWPKGRGCPNIRPRNASARLHARRKTEILSLDRGAIALPPIFYRVS